MVSGQVQLGVEELAGASEGDEPIHRHREQKKVDDDEAQDDPGERLNEERVDRAHEVRVDGQVDQGKADLGKHDGPQWRVGQLDAANNLESCPGNTKGPFYTSLIYYSCVMSRI